MFEPMLVLQTLGAAAVTAAAVLLLCAWLGRGGGWVRSLGGVLGVGLGFLAGGWLLGLSPGWPPREDQDRLLLVLLPALLAVELAAALAGRFRLLAWLPRLVIAAGAARLLLHHTVYLEDLAGPGSREWTEGQAWLVLAGLAAALAATWGLLALLLRRAPGRAVPLALAVACAGAAVALMLSGYASGGLLGLPLAAALAGAVLASLLLSGPVDLDGLLGVGVVGLFGLVVIGRFFGELTTFHAALVFFAPLLCWLPELPFLRRLNPRLRGVAAVLLAVAPLVVALTLAHHKFAADSTGTSSGDPEEVTAQDYLDFGK